MRLGGDVVEGDCEGAGGGGDEGDFAESGGEGL